VPYADGEWPGTRVLVLGASRSGRAAAVALARRGASVVLSDTKARASLGDVAGLERAGVALVVGEQTAALLERVALVVKSPGVPAEVAVVEAARARGVPVWSELELAFRLFPNPFTAVTGTNGKTTTTALLGHMFATAGRPAHVAGNIGAAVTALPENLDPGDELVVEVSSFQLEDVDRFRPAAGVFLNLTPDHLDRHGTMQRYLACKTKLFARQGVGDAAVLNVGDAAVRAVADDLSARAGGPRVARFATAAGVGLDSWLADGRLYLDGRPAVAVDELPLRGLHNVENCLAAGTAALARGLDWEAVIASLRSFPGVPHRLERAGSVRGVAYVNDSKATNVEATLKALAAYPEGTHLILGGRDKASDYRPVARACAHGCRSVYLIGEATPLIAEAFARVRADERIESVPEPHEYGDLETAVRVAAATAVPGDVVLLAPACASFDQYADFEARGRHFVDIVGRLQRETDE
jgi:UDP-N-acetylmuramoylalanine--D-glutamate ligase